MKYGRNAKTFVSTLLLPVLPVLAMGLVALASSVDEAIVDTTAPAGNVELAPGAGAPIVINLTVTGKQDGTATFKIYCDWTLSGGTFTGSNPQTFTVPPRDARDQATTFSTAGTVAVDSSQADGTFTLAVGAFDITNSNSTGAKLSAGSSGNYQVIVAAPPAPTDTTAPVIAYTITPAPNAAGWNNTDVTIEWSASDAESGIASGPTPASMTVTTEGRNQSCCCEATNGAGLTATSEMYVSIDKTKPVVTISLPGTGVYLLNQTVANATWAAADNLSGVIPPDGGDLPIDTTSVGSKTLVVPADEVEDYAGNTSLEASADYSVHYAFDGILPPINMDGSSVFKQGSTVPVKFLLKDANGAFVSNAVASIRVAQISDGVTEMEVEAVSTTAATTGNLFRYDPLANQYIFNWSTKGLNPGTW